MGKIIAIPLYNPLNWEVKQVMKFKTNTTNIDVLDSLKNKITSQIETIYGNENTYYR